MFFLTGMTLLRSRSLSSHMHAGDMDEILRMVAPDAAVSLVPLQVHGHLCGRPCAVGLTLIAVHRTDEQWAVTVNLGPKCTDVHVDNGTTAGVVIRPSKGQELRSTDAYNAECCILGCEMQRQAGSTYIIHFRVELEVGETEHPRRRMRCSSGLARRSIARTRVLVSSGLKGLVR
jgi:hypothetical protein